MNGQDTASVLAIDVYKRQGEKKLEMDRRLISERIGALKKELEEVKRHRDLIREGRQGGNLKTAAIVGYTNAGKSTLLNVLTLSLIHI